MTTPRVAATVTAAALAITIAAALTGCTDSGDPMPTPPAPSTTPSATAISEPQPEPDTEPTPDEPQPPQFLPGGTALANKDYFDYVSRDLFDRKPNVDTRGIINALVTAGFDKTAMQITKDTTPTGRKPEAIEYSVRAHDDCLIGQWGKNRYTSYIAPVLANGDCLIGDTRPIDW